MSPITQNPSHQRLAHAPGRPAHGHWILGPGAVGRLLAMRLADSVPVTLIGRRPPPVRLTLTTPEGERETRELPGATLESLPPTPPTMLHLTTKAYGVEAAIAALADRLPAETPLVLWQNGFSVQEALTRTWPGPVLCASTTEGAFVDDTPADAGDRAGDRVGDRDQGIIHAGHGRTVIGHLEGAYPALATTLAGILSAAELPCEAVEDIRVRLWHKLAVNAAINPLVARFRIRNGQLRDRPFQPMVEALVAELAAIMAAENIPSPAGGWSDRVWDVVENTANNRASMLQDVLAGRPTEIDAILGPLIEAARRHGLAVPALASNYRAMCPPAS
ncbi:ketopantoate reductase family protein [Onishia niordana]|uniref:ketopantoate reductase family protein n=1 Tax=Onishia niordana TaxID=2508711 RepID=UPI00109EE33D|nr:2-dehydropantoate 2-reductase [Halomonas niordiana]